MNMSRLFHLVDSNEIERSESEEREREEKKRLNYTLDAHIHTLICSHRLTAGKWERKIPMTFILIREREREN